MSGKQVSSILRLAGLVLIAISVFIFMQIAYTDIYAAYMQDKLKSEWGKPSATKPDPPSSNPSITKTQPKDHGENDSNGNKPSDPGVSQDSPYGKVFARLAIPKIGIDTIVLEGVSLDVLTHGPGHMESTAYPGEIGNVVISGHRVTYSHPFYNLDQLQVGDPIYICTQAHKYTYYVAESKVVKPTDMSVTLPTSDRTLTLTTCNPRFSASTRLVIVAKMR